MPERYQWNFDICATCRSWRRAAFRTSGRAFPCRAASVVAADAGSGKGAGIPPVRSVASRSPIERGGESVFGRCATDLQDVDDAKRHAEQIAVGKAGTLRIGIAIALSWHGVVADSFRKFRRRQPAVELVVHHLLSVHQVDAVLSGRLDAGFAATITPWHKDLAHWQFAQERLLLAVPKGHPLTKRKRIRLRDLRNMPFVGFQRWANPAFYDELMQAYAAAA